MAQRRAGREDPIQRRNVGSVVPIGPIAIDSRETVADGVVAGGPISLAREWLGDPRPEGGFMRSAIRKAATVTVGVAAAIGISAVSAPAASATGVYVCYDPDSYQSVDYPGVLGGGHIIYTPAVEGVQTTRCNNAGTGIELPVA